MTQFDKKQSTCVALNLVRYNHSKRAHTSTHSHRQPRVEVHYALFYNSKRSHATRLVGICHFMYAYNSVCLVLNCI